MRVDTNRIPLEGLTLKEEIPLEALDLDTDIIKFIQPVKVTAEISKITNAVTMQVYVDALTQVICSRCLNEFKSSLKKEISLNYPTDKAKPIIDLNPEIREEIILDYPINPLCNINCKGLCVKCGKNLNEGGCSCGTT